MVRHKTRWLVVRLDTAETIGMNSWGRKRADGQKADFPQKVAAPPHALPSSKKEIYTAIKNQLNSTLGLSGHGIDLQVRFWDPLTCFLLMRIPRDDCGRVRASLTVWTYLEATDRNNTASRNTQRNRKVRLAASVLSVSGSARTAKRATMHHLRTWYRGHLRLATRSAGETPENSPSVTASMQRYFNDGCQRLQDSLSAIQVID